ncbi:hypothetical protein chiPu_0032118, partial [Chiloscyllium punctatum]|nr:hypothetical protein [Chiloscyllium punctatum]
MPRLAPVRSSVRRGALDGRVIDGFFRFRHARRRAGHRRLRTVRDQDVDGRAHLTRRRASR